MLIRDANDDSVGEDVSMHSPDLKHSNTNTTKIAYLWMNRQGFNLDYENYVEGFELGHYGRRTTHSNDTLETLPDPGNWEFFLGLRRLAE